MRKGLCIRLRAVLIGLAAVLALSLLLAAALDRVGLPSTRQVTFDGEIEIYSRRSAGQSFVAEAPGLHRVDLLLARRGPNSRPVLFHLRRQCADGEDLVVIQTSASLLEDVSNPIRRPNLYKPFTFPPIEDSASHRFYFYVESPLSSAQHPILLKLQSQDSYPNGTRYVDGIEEPGDLAFKAYYSGAGPLSTADLLLTRLTENKPFPLSEKAFYLIALCTYLILVILVARVLRVLCRTLMS